MIYRNEETEHEYMVRESGGRWHIYMRRCHRPDPNSGWRTYIQKHIGWCDTWQEAENALEEMAELKGLQPVEERERAHDKPRAIKRDSRG